LDPPLALFHCCKTWTICSVLLLTLRKLVFPIFFIMITFIAIITFIFFNRMKIFKLHLVMKITISLFQYDENKFK
jgi:hypothetical protein